MYVTSLTNHLSDTANRASDCCHLVVAYDVTQIYTSFPWKAHIHGKPSTTHSLNQTVTPCTLYMVDDLFNDSASSSDDIVCCK